MLLCRRTDLSSESIIFYHRFPSRTHKKLSSKCSLIFQNLKMDRFVLFFVLLTLSPGRGQVFNFFKKLYLFVFGAADSQQKVKIEICDCNILTFVPGGL